MGTEIKFYCWFMLAELLLRGSTCTWVWKKTQTK